MKDRFDGTRPRQAGGSRSQPSARPSLEIVIQPQLLTFDPELLKQWKAGVRESCSDLYCRRLPGSAGFGEFIVGSFFEAKGYRWIHHDFDIFGSNRPGKHPASEAVLLEFFGRERLDAARSIGKIFGPFRAAPETPDPLAYKDGELRFAEILAGRIEPARRTLMFGRVLELFDGDADAARRWLSNPQPVLGGAIPLEVAKTPSGAREVEAAIGRLEHGVFS